MGKRFPPRPNEQWISLPIMVRYTASFDPCHAISKANSSCYHWLFPISHFPPEPTVHRSTPCQAACNFAVPHPPLATVANDLQRCSLRQFLPPVCRWMRAVGQTDRSGDNRRDTHLLQSISVCSLVDGPRVLFCSIQDPITESWAKPHAPSSTTASSMAKVQS